MRTIMAGHEGWYEEGIGSQEDHGWWWGKCKDECPTMDMGDHHWRENNDTAGVEYQ